MTDHQPSRSPGRDRGRPGYPAAAAQWLTGGPGRTVLEIGAGTGRLTALLAEQGHDVHATEPDPALLALLREAVPAVRCSQAAAAELPAPDRSVDLVVCAQAHDRCGVEQALPEIARVLKPGGHLALVWNQRDSRIPWVRRLGVVLGDTDPRPDPAAPLMTSELFGFVDQAEFRHWQDINRETIVGLAASCPAVAALDEEARQAKLAEVVAFYDDYGRGMDGMQLPHVARCFRAQVVDRGAPALPAAAGATSAGDDVLPEGPSVSDGSDTDMLLIDFR